MMVTVLGRLKDHKIRNQLSINLEQQNGDTRDMPISSFKREKAHRTCCRFLNGGQDILILPQVVEDLDGQEDKIK